MREELTEKVKGAAQAPIQNLSIAISKVAGLSVAPRVAGVDAVVLGISTGGPQALRFLIPQLPADFPVPLLIVLHMPVGYTALFATKLAELSSIKVQEANDGDVLQPGTVWVAKAGQHLSLKRNLDGRVRLCLSLNPRDRPHRPSVDVLFRSAAEVFKSRVLGVVMTGMGDDGREGSAWIKAQGGRILTESEKSCVIYGMPRTVDEAGLSDASVPLGEMAAAILRNL